MKITHDGLSWYLYIEGVKIEFDSEELAMEFTIKLLKDTGRIGY